jgi:hypothetical protein
MPISVAAGSPPPAGSSADNTPNPAEEGFSPSGPSSREQRLRDGLEAERPALPALLPAGTAEKA